MKKYLCLIGVLGVLLCNTANSYAQKVAVKTNLLYDATTTMNLGLEIGLGKKWSLDLSGNYNPWKFDDETRLRHWGVQPELRYWLCEKFNGHFLGLHGHYAKYNVGGMSFLSDNMEHHRYQGHLWGGGISYGYQWLLDLLIADGRCVEARQPLESGGCAWSRLCAAGPLQISLCHMRHRSEK